MSFCHDVVTDRVPCARHDIVGGVENVLPYQSARIPGSVLVLLGHSMRR